MAATPRTDERLAALGILGVVVAVTSWGIGPVIVKATDLPGPTVSVHRLTLGAVLAVAIASARGRRLSWPLLRAALPGGAAFALDIVLFFTAVKRTSVTDATVIAALQPALLLVIAGPLFGERVRAAHVALTGVAVAGVAAVVAGSGAGAGRTLTGDLLAVAALGAWTWYFVAVKQARRTHGALEYQAAISLVAAVVAVPIVLLLGAPVAVSDADQWAFVAATVLLGAGGHFVMNWAHAYTPIVLSSLLTLASPVISVAVAAAWLGEPVNGTQVAGIVVVLVSLGAVVVQTARDRGSLPEETAEEPR